MINFQKVVARPSSCKLRASSNTTVKLAEYPLRRPITAKLSPSKRNSTFHSQIKHNQTPNSRNHIKSVEKKSECRSIFATDLRFVLEQQNIKKMNVQIEKIFHKKQSVSRSFHRPSSGAGGNNTRGRYFKNRVSSASYSVNCNVHKQNKRPLQSIKIENKTFVEDRQSQQHSHLEIFNEEQLSKKRAETTKFVQQSRSKLYRFLLHYQSPAFSCYKGYSAIQELGQQMIQNQVQLVQKSMQQPRPKGEAQDSNYYWGMVAKIEQVEDSIQEIMSRPRLSLM